MALMSPTMTLINSGLTLAVYWIGAYLIEAAGTGLRLGIFSDMVVFSSYAMQVILAFMMLNMIFVLLPRAQVSASESLKVLNTQSRNKDGSGDDRYGLTRNRGISQWILPLPRRRLRYADGYQLQSRLRRNDRADRSDRQRQDDAS